MGTQRVLRIPAGCALAAVFAGLAGAQAQEDRSVREAPRQVIVAITRAAARAAVDAGLALDGCTVVEELPALRLVLVALPDGASVDGALERLNATPGIAYAERNGTGQAGCIEPNDTFFSFQWPLENTGQFGGRPGADIEARRGWELACGSPAVVVAVVDSGLVSNHPEFAGRALPGHDFVSEDANPHDENGHGTAVAGILAANAGNRFGLSGVDHACTLLPVRVLNRRGNGTTFDLAQGLVYAADSGADVINLSLINYPSTQTLRDALSHARDAGCVLIACAGNGGIGNADVSFPGRSPLVISVGATTRTDARAVFSGTGASLDLVAPGDDVPATAYATFDTFFEFSGCSAATPIASGIAAVALSIDPTLGHAEIRDLLVAGAEDLVGPPQFDTPGRDDHFGHGRVNLFRTLCALDAGGPAIVAPDVVRIECPAPGGIQGDDPLLGAALGSVLAFDDLDPEPALSFDAPGFLPFAKTTAVLFHAQDACGHETERAVAVAVVDTRPPTPALRLERARLDPLDGGLVAVGVRAEATDVCDLAPALELLVHADEPAPGRGQHDARIDAKGHLFLRAERDAGGDGRVYLCIVRAHDDSGNVGSACAAVVVPEDDTPEALERVLDQARAALEECQLTGTAPAGFALLASAWLPDGESARAQGR